MGAVVPLLSAPLTTRLYDPEAFGRFAIVVTIANIVALPFVAGLSRSLLLAPSTEVAGDRYKNITAILPVAFFILLGAFALFSIIAPEYGLLLLFAAICFALISALSVATSWMVHSNAYNGLTRIRVVESVSSALLIISLGMLGFKEYGIIAGYTVGQLICFATIWRFLPSSRLQLWPSWQPIVEIYRENPKLFYTSLPAEALNTFTRSLPVLMLSAFSSTAVSGLFNIAMRLLEVPAGLVAGAFAQYFQSIAISRHNEGKALRPLIIAFSGSLFLLGLPLVLISMPLLPDLAAWALGDKWRQSGVFAQYLMLFIFLRVVVSPVTFVIFLHRAFLVNLCMDIALFLSICTGFYWTLSVLENIEMAIAVFGATYSFGYVIIFLISLHYGRRSKPAAALSAA